MELLSMEFPECLLKILVVPLVAYGVLVLVVLADMIRQLMKKP